MKQLIYTFFGLAILFISCKKESSISPLTCNNYSQTLYYSNEIFPSKYLNVYGDWKLIRFSGGIQGHDSVVSKNYKINICKYGMIRLVKDLHETNIGKIEIISETPSYLDVRFKFDKIDSFFFYGDDEKQINQVSHDSMWINSDCCDRYNYLFKRE
ncbi:MAG: hypothetical protein ABI851_06065 [Saprospiraceae bacterium]